MKKTYKFLAIVGILAVIIVGYSSCKAGCGCPSKTFQLEQTTPLQ